MVRAGAGAHGGRRRRCPGVGFRIQFDAEGRRWHQVAEDGAITEWAAGDIADPDIEVRIALDVARRYYRGEADGTETLAACRRDRARRRGGTAQPARHRGATRARRDALPARRDAPHAVPLLGRPVRCRSSGGGASSTAAPTRWGSAGSTSPDAVVKIAVPEAHRRPHRLDLDLRGHRGRPGRRRRRPAHAARRSPGVPRAARGRARVRRVGPGLLAASASSWTSPPSARASRPWPARRPDGRAGLLAAPHHRAARGRDRGGPVHPGCAGRGRPVRRRARGRSALGDDGRGTPVEPDTVFRVYCTIKPVTVLAVARLVDDGTLDLDEPLARAAARVPGAGRRRRSRSAGSSTTPPACTARWPSSSSSCRPEKRVEHLEQFDRPVDFTVGVDAGYSEWFGWHVVGRAARGGDRRAVARAPPAGRHRAARHDRHVDRHDPGRVPRRSSAGSA